MTSRLAACVWAGLFAIVHVYWLAGGRAGLPRDAGTEFGSPLFVASLVAVPLLAMSGAAAMIARRQAAASLRRLSVPWVGLVALFGLAHAIPPLLDHFMLPSTGQGADLSERERYALYLYEPNWLIGGMLFATAWRRSRKP